MGLITVNIPLDRFKEMESAEMALHAILKDKQKYSIYHSPFNDRTYYLNSLDTLSKELAEQMQQAINERNNTIDKWRTNDPKSFHKINK